MDEDGYFYVLDRKKDMIIRAGLKVYPAKVEKVLRDAQADRRRGGRRPRRRGAHRDGRRGRRGEAAAAPDGRSDAKLAEELREPLCREHLAPYEVPPMFEFVDTLPRSALGKLLKRELRKAPRRRRRTGRSRDRQRQADDGRTAPTATASTATAMATATATATGRRA